MGTASKAVGRVLVDVHGGVAVIVEDALDLLAYFTVEDLRDADASP
jgi:hypothetical protein